MVRLGCDDRAWGPGALGFLGEMLSRHSWAVTLGGKGMLSSKIPGLTQVIGSD